MDNLKIHIARYADADTRKLLGFDIEDCIKHKFPPNKVRGGIQQVPYRITKSDILRTDETRWLVSNDNRLHVQRSWREDAYCIDDIKYTHHFDYTDGRIHIWVSGTAFEDSYSSSYSLSPP